ncbi:hypothetical protein [Cryptosporangium aurantiacum]|uniref:Uncharacterized protein n=1 Tax=Cryptosporangium aurantiacum TaxID=134849 RepID=A0A1M7RJF5_9ACTN|nr:hypothetical protein [Cryptosporangium aurantiacum]SHN46443.1 hypothetical protein SAMN05443668_115132 [Cryptosporangium aurantiacum]
MTRTIPTPQAGLFDPEPLTALTPPTRLPAGPRDVLPRPVQHGEQGALLEPPVEPEPPSLPYRAADPAPLSAALVGDRYDWLAAVLPDPAPVWCTAHRAVMRRVGAARLLYACDRCTAERPDSSAGVAA